MKRAQTPLSLRRATIRDLLHVTGGAPGFGQNDKVFKRTEDDSGNNGNANGHDKDK